MFFFSHGSGFHDVEMHKLAYDGRRLDGKGGRITSQTALGERQGGSAATENWQGMLGSPPPDLTGFIGTTVGSSVEMFEKEDH